MPSSAASYRGPRHTSAGRPDEGDVPGVRQKSDTVQLEVLDCILKLHYSSNTYDLLFDSKTFNKTSVFLDRSLVLYHYPGSV